MPQSTLSQPAESPHETPFVLLGHAGTGSNLVMYSLMEHPKIAMSGELLHPNENVRRELEAAGGPYYSYEEDGAHFLGERVLARRPEVKKLARGFKIFYKHARSGPARTAWDYLLANRDIRIIHLTRRNLVECHLSLQVAARTGRWQERDANTPAPAVEPFHVDPGYCHDYLNEMTALQLWARSAFAGHPLLELEYEDVCGDYAATIDRICRFLDVPPYPVEARPVKQEATHAAKLILNLEECKEYFRHTLFQPFFEERFEKPAVEDEDQEASGKKEPRATRFVLLCHARTGSNLVLRAMTNHPQLAAFGEVLNHDVTTRAQIAQSAPLGEALYQEGEDGATFADQKIFIRNPRRPIRACGFKMFYEYARWNRSMSTFWDYLTANPDIRIIHLTRRNLLECVVSHKVAEATGQWFLTGEMPKREAKRFWLNPEDCHTYFDRIMTWRAWVAKALKDHPMLEIEYEKDLCGNFEDAMDRVFTFLGVASHRAEREIEKQQVKSLQEQVENFEELKQHFRHTIFEDFFTGDGQ